MCVCVCVRVYTLVFGREQAVGNSIRKAVSSLLICVGEGIFLDWEMWRRGTKCILEYCLPSSC